MARNHNTDRNGNSWSENTKKTVWNKGVILPGEDSSKVRKDTCGAWIQWDKHGDTTENGYGWEIDHKKPVAKGGDDDVNNLQPLQWQNNRRKSDDYPANNFCAVTATNNLILSGLTLINDFKLSNYLKKYGLDVFKSNKFMELMRIKRFKKQTN